MNEDEYRNYDCSNVAGLGTVSRRDFLRYTGGGVIVFFSVGSTWAAEGRQRGGEGEKDFNAYLRIGEDGRVTCFTGKIEMGQGVITSLAQMLADELDVAFDRVDMVMGDTALCPYDRGTFGSMSTRFFGPPLRAAAAEARAVLIELAAERLNAPVDRLQARDGVIFDKAHNENQVTYAQLTEGKRIERHLKDKPSVKEVAALNLIGKPVGRTDAVQKVTGKAQYAGDVRLPGMLYAKILRPPAHGAQLRSVDTSAVEKIEGVQLVRDGDLLAVLHEKPDVAEEALKKLAAEFDVPETTVDDQNIFDHLLGGAPKGRDVQHEGDIGSGEKLAEAIVEKTYLNSYVAHATIETHSALAKVEGDTATVWASTQAPFMVQEAIARALGVPAQNVRVITPFVGGGFGGKTRSSQAVEAARLAKQTQRPVQVVWSRAEEFFYDSFRPAAVVRIRSGISKSGELVFWDYGVYAAGERGADLFYDVPHLRTTAYGEWGSGEGPHPFATGPWRAPSNNTNTFARESHMNVLAVEAGMDPVEFRLKNLSNERMVRVLKTAAERFGWTPAKAPSGRGFGVACGIDVGTYVATMAEVEVAEETGHVQVKRVVCAQDMGLVVNPEGVTLQMEGCITMGLGYALTEEVHFKGGNILETGFGTYKLPCFSWLPEIETVLVENKDLPPQGGGEPTIICMGGVVANAVFDATGARLFQLPMTAERIKEAVSKRA